MGNLAEMKHLHPAPLPGARPRLLIPIDATEASRWALAYACRLAQAGTPPEICLLFVAEPVHSWEVLRFYTEEEVRRHFQQRSALFLDEAAARLQEAGLASRSFFREAETVPGIVDLAEELACTEIVVPATHWLGVFPTGLARKLLQRPCAVPVTLVREDGSTVV